MGLQDKLDAFKARFQSGLPPFAGLPADTHALMRRATEELQASGLAARAVTSGAAPPFDLEASGGGRVRLAELLQAGPLVLSFYRGIWCPFCNLDLAELEAHAPAIRAAGASLLAITPQSPAHSRKLVADHRLGYPVASDPGNEVAARYGLRFRLPDDLIDLYQRLGVRLPAFNLDESWTLPMPARYVIDRGGKIRYAVVSPDYTVRPDPNEVLPTLERLATERVA